MIELLAVAAGWILVGLASLAVVLFVPSAGRPPRHARPEGWTGPTMPAPSPIVSPTMTDEQRQVLRHDVPDLGTWKPSPLSRESVRRRFRIALNESLGRPVV